MSDYEYGDHEYEDETGYLDEQDGLYEDDEDVYGGEDIYGDEDEDWGQYQQEFSEVLNPGDYGRLSMFAETLGVILTPKERALLEFKNHYLALSGSDTIAKKTISNIEKLNVIILNMNILAHVTYVHDAKINPKNYKPFGGNQLNTYDFYRYIKLYNSTLD